MTIIYMCRKYRASEKVFIVFCILPITHLFNLHHLFFKDISCFNILIQIFYVVV